MVFALARSVPSLKNRGFWWLKFNQQASQDLTRARRRISFKSKGKAFKKDHQLWRVLAAF